MLCTPANPATDAEAYDAVVAELTRGIREVSGLEASAAEPGWLAVRCASPAMASWLAESTERENITARAVEDDLLLPVSADYTLENEIKSLITVTAKTTDYWFNHLPPEVKQTLVLQHTLGQWKRRLLGWRR